MKENTIRLYEHFCKLVENPTGVDLAEKKNVLEQAQKAKANLEQRFKTSKKYKDDPEIKALLGVKEVKEEVKEVKKEVKKR